ncbi:hypothetical protein FB566_1369 [Stackebrandtia endophytica]|uniref:Transposase n=1 Tax=Stackebrandtia endophytica TaxID=1496996 RepID=A0A543ATE1_9ACTN|nr:hypothetical protein [Stackebrandtia endophytica]TQL75854.1 hypothetical protein FB566_1369 [Stackebrandtia endophytica]
MRIFCGLANVNEAVAAALVNERGGVVATAEVSDDPHGYLALCHMWVRHATIPSVTVADDGSTTALLRLAAGAGQPVTTDAPRPDGAEDGLDIAVHIARALCHGALPTAIENSEPELGRVLAAVQGLATSRHAARGALVELLRQCHPAVLMAWEDPTDDDALALLRVIPDPAQAETADATKLVGALRSVADPRTIGSLIQSLSDVATAMDPVVDRPGVPEAIVGAIDAVRSCDHALDALAESVTAILRPTRTSRREPVTEPVAPQPRSAPRATPPPPPAPAAVPPPAPTPPRERVEPQPRIPAPAISEEQLPRRQSPPRPSEPHRSEPMSSPHVSPVMAEQLPVEPVEPLTPSHGFPQMPEPPSFVEPLTEHLPHMTEVGPDLLSAPAGELPSDMDSEDEDLLIFSQARSAWFQGPAALEDEEEDWTPADAGWRAAAAAATSQNTPAETTGTGLPRRVPQANLVPGSAILGDSKPVPIKRDASTLASHTAGYFRGWTRARRETVGAGTR